MRAARPEGDWLDFDIFLHRGGRVTERCEEIAAGARVMLTGPGGRGVKQVGWMGILGDETALPVVLRAIARAVLRRTMRAAPDDHLRLGHLALDPQAHRAFVTSDAGEELLDLTPTEFRILGHMMHHPGRAFSRTDLVDACLPEAAALDRTVDNHVSNLRRKLIAAGADGMLEDVRRIIGYRLDRARAG